MILLNMKRCLLLIFVLALAGCGSIATRQDDDPLVYKGVHEDLECLKSPNDFNPFIGNQAAKCFAWLDLPLSFTVDTVFLPFDVIKDRMDRGEDAAPEQNKTKETGK